MLNVPDSIKELFHTDSVNKNIRIHFPNGERTDICNDLIVKDSVSFKESLCSQDSLKFGMCESPVFQCETVGVGNIKGAKIEVYCEIICDSSISGAEWKADIQKHVYAIPYGKFVVKEAKRQADLNHRVIIAYSSINIYDNTSFSNDYNISNHYLEGDRVDFYIEAKNQETVKEQIIRKDASSATIDIIKKLYAKLNMLDDLVTLSDVTSSSYINPYNTLSISADNLIIYAYYGAEKLYQNNSNLYYAEIKPSDYTAEEIYQWASDAIDYYKENDTYYHSDDIYETFRRYVRTFLLEGRNIEKIIEEDLLSTTPTSIFTVNGFTYWDGQTTEGNSIKFTSPIYDNNLVLYPHNPSYNTSLDASSAVYIAVPYQIIIEDRHNRHSKYLTLRRHETNPAPYYYSLKKVNCDYFGYTTTQQRMYMTRKIWSAHSNQWYTYTGLSLIPFNVEFYQKIWKGYYEIGGLFGYLDRYGTVKSINIKRKFNLLPASNLYPNSNLHPEGAIGGKILPDDYQTCWYDDEYRKYFGAIKCTYKNSNNDVNDFTLFLPGYNKNTDVDTYYIYDLSGNGIIDSTTFTQYQIETICNRIANSLNFATYMPVDFKGRGLPYVEAGDTFEILTRSNDSITTIVLNRTITGEQTLVDTYQSV